MEFLDPPAVDDGVENRFEVTQPQYVSASYIERRAVIEPLSED